MFNRLLEMNLSFEVREWDFLAGRSNEDNTEIIGTQYCVVVEDQEGYRWLHHHVFMSGEMIFDDDGFNHWHQDRKADAGRAQALADRIKAHLEAGGSLNPEHWVETQGCYGSAAWDESLEMALEAQEDRW